MIPMRRNWKVRIAATPETTGSGGRVIVSADSNSAPPNEMFEVSPK